MKPAGPRVQAQRPPRAARVHARARAPTEPRAFGEIPLPPLPPFPYLLRVSLPYVLAGDAGARAKK